MYYSDTYNLLIIVYSEQYNYYHYSSIKKMNYTKFKALRNKKGISQEELAKRSGVNIRTIQSLECGARSTHRMTLENAYRLALVLGIQLTAFLDNKSIEFPDGRTGEEFEADNRAAIAAKKKEKELREESRYRPISD